MNADNRNWAKMELQRTFKIYSKLEMLSRTHIPETNWTYNDLQQDGSIKLLPDSSFTVWKLAWALCRGERSLGAGIMYDKQPWRKQSGAEQVETSHLSAFLQQALEPLRRSVPGLLSCSAPVLTLIVVLVQTQLEGNSYQGGHQLAALSR